MSGNLEVINEHYSSGKFVLLDIKPFYKTKDSEIQLSEGKFSIIQRFNEAATQQGWVKEDVYKVINHILLFPDIHWFIGTLKLYCVTS